MRVLWVLYDRRCGLCRAARARLQGLAQHVPLRFVPNDDLPDWPLFAEAGRLPTDEVVVVADDGRAWTGAKGFVMCLWATRRYRRLARRLSRPALLPAARAAVNLVGRHRHVLSGWLGLSSDAGLREAILTESGAEPPCPMDQCTAPDRRRGDRRTYAGPRIGDREGVRS